MRAAVIEAMGTDPVVRRVPVPEATEGKVVVRITSAGLNPTDQVASTGIRGPLPVPYVPGTEGVGRLTDGTRVYACPTRLPHGSIAEYSLVDPDRAYPIPDGLADADALAIGIAGCTAWLATTWKGRLRAGESVLVMGATGAVGRVAVQAASILGASRVVAAGRDAAVLESLRHRGADDVVVLDGDYEQRLVEASHGGFDLVVDGLFAEPMAAALRVTAHGGRVVNLGMRAGRTMQLNGLQWKGRDLLSYDFLLPPADVYRQAYHDLAGHILSGRMTLESETLPLDAIPDGWRQLAAGVHTKLVVAIDGDQD